MSDSDTVSHPGWCRACCRISVRTAIAGGLLALLGWAAGLDVLKGFGPGMVAMNPATAVGIILTGLALRYLATPADLRSPAATRTGRTCASVAGLIGLVKLGAELLGLEAGIDQLLFAGSLGGNVMAPNAAGGLMTLGTALLLLDTRTRRGFWIGQVPALAAAAFFFLAIIGYAFDASALYGVPSYMPMALNTAILLLVLALGVLLARPDWGFMAVVTNQGADGPAVRRLLLTAIVVPVLLGWLRLQGERAGLYEAEFGVTLMVGITVILFMGAVWWTGCVLQRVEAERRLAQQLLREAHDRLEERVEARTAELAAANHELAQQVRENETFVYSVSHDLRSPLVNLQGFSKELALVCQDVRAILDDDALPPAVRERGVSLIDVDMAESVRFIQTSVLRLSHIIDALLRLSRAGRVEYRPQPVDVRDVVMRIVESMSITIADRGAVVSVAELPLAWGDATAIEQVFANLIGNALNYLDPKRPGEIEIGCTSSSRATAGPPSCTFFVRDNGLGIPTGHQQKLFQAFQRLHPNAAKGEGMGLAIVKRIVERHGGRIWVESRAGVGSTFFVELPSPATGSPPSSPATRPTEPMTRSTTHGGRTADYSLSGRR